MVEIRVPSRPTGSSERARLPMSSWHELQRSRLVRKSAAMVRHLPRAIRRARAAPADYLAHPPLLANSFPKSGTHLLLQILTGVPGTTHYGSFIASLPAITFRERSLAAHLRRLRWLTPGEVVGAHLFHHEHYAAALTARNCAHVFIYRDPRDVVVSDTHYLTHHYRWHRLHRHFAHVLETEEARLSAVILGLGDRAPEFPDVGRRFARYRGWLGRDDVCAVRFEDLVGPGREVAIRRIVAFHAARAARPVDLDAAVAAAMANIDPARSHTFREGRVGGWRRTFGPRHVEEMARVAGPLLIELGYERDDGWTRDVAA